MRRWSTELLRSCGDFVSTAGSVRNWVRDRRKHRQRFLGLLTIYKRIMPMSFARKLVICWGLVVASPLVLSGQTNLIPQDSEYPILTSTIGDQTAPRTAISANGGFLVWQDNVVTTLGL